MSHVGNQVAGRSSATTAEREGGPEELLALRERIRGMPASVRDELEPIVDEAIEEAQFRGRILSVAREALLRQRLELAMARFDLDATRREREILQELLDARS